MLPQLQQNNSKIRFSLLFVTHFPDGLCRIICMFSPGVTFNRNFSIYFRDIPNRELPLNVIKQKLSIYDNLLSISTPMSNGLLLWNICRFFTKNFTKLPGPFLTRTLGAKQSVMEQY